jgi:hypothetical protein
LDEKASCSAYVHLSLTVRLPFSVLLFPILSTIVIPSSVFNTTTSTSCPSTTIRRDYHSHPHHHQEEEQEQEDEHDLEGRGTKRVVEEREEEEQQGEKDYVVRLMTAPGVFGEEGVLDPQKGLALGTFVVGRER